MIIPNVIINKKFRKQFFKTVKRNLFKRKSNLKIHQLYDFLSIYIQFRFFQKQEHK